MQQRNFLLYSQTDIIRLKSQREEHDRNEEKLRKITSMSMALMEKVKERKDILIKYSKKISSIEEKIDCQRNAIIALTRKHLDLINCQVGHNCSVFNQL